ncbi:MAG: TonB-dependent receptor [Proteobacteria bacterium]|nr:TonB-dependent receptor [Pseudomonadota bacterium]
MPQPSSARPASRPSTLPPLAARVSAVLAACAAAAPVLADGDLQEVIVTATRRDQRVTDIPYNISAVGAADLQSAGVTDLQSLTRMVPGLVSPDLGPRASSSINMLTIRGLNASSVNDHDQTIAAPLVSTYVDETPLFANLKMTDIERVEVLRGPQGTLYGSGSVGGTVRLIHAKPDPTTTLVEVTARGAKTANAADPDSAVDAIVNIPLGPALALRASAGYEKLAGFTDAASLAVLDSNRQPVLANPADPLNSPPLFTSARGVDAARVGYARAALRYLAGEHTELTLSYQHQTDSSDGFSQQHPGERYTQHLYVSQPGDTQTDLGALDLSVDFGFATLSSSSSYTRQSSTTTFDLTGLIEDLASLYGNYPRTLSPIDAVAHDQSFTQELRLVSTRSGPWEWVLGGYFNNRHQSFTQSEPILGFASWSEIPGSGRPPGCTVFDATTCPYPTFGDVIQFYNGGIRPSQNAYPDLNFTLDRHVAFRDLAAFNETTYHFSDRWQATAGARIFWQHYEQTLAQTLPMCGPFCSQSGTDPTGLTYDANAKGFRSQIFKLNSSYEVAPHTLVYATWSEGFRHGGVNALPTGGCFYCESSSLLTYKSDTARNTEVGIKGSFGGGSSYTLTVYNIDWTDPQIEASTIPGGFFFVVNGDKARSRGIESELAWRVSTSTRLSLGYSYTDAVLTRSFQRGDDDVAGYAGDRLPGVSRQQVTAAADYTVPLTGQASLHLHGDAAYRSSFWTSLPHSPTAAELPGFTLVNLRGGVAFGDSWQLDAFVSNLTNQAAATAIATVPGPDHNRVEYVGRPRTAGLELRYSFRP